MKNSLLINLLAVAIVTVSGTSHSATNRDEPLPSWSFAFENDILAGGDSDRDYTYGLNFTLSDNSLAQSRFTPQPVLTAIDDLVGIGSSNQNRYSLEVGVYGFTPDDITVAEPIYDDRPYASLLYAQSRHERINLAEEYSWTSSLSVGVLGLDLAGSAQNRFHRAIDGNEAQGWKHQISDGGEITARYTVARQQIVHRTARTEIKVTHQGSVGYISEAGVGLSIRGGNFADSWWSFDPDLATYGERGVQGQNHSAPEAYWWAGFNIKARLYNAFLQGQFRDSDISYSSNELRHGLLEAWAGYTLGFRNGYRLSYYVRGHTSEIREGHGDRHLVWGGIAVSKQFGR
ncbi:hypothetical protein NBRC116494_22860 [Aurantivibrio plasticivorans]